MADPITDRFDTYEPEDEADDYTWEDDTVYRDPKPNVLWGRVAILGGMLLLAFLFGRMTKSAGVPAADLERAQSRIETLQSENAELKTEIAAQEAAEPAAPAEDPATDTEDPEAAEAADSPDQTYVVKSGDSLTIIAQRFYGDPSLDDFLAEANNIADPTKLSVGQELRIPPNPNEE